jgi:hypothetical protein
MNKIKFSNGQEFSIDSIDLVEKFLSGDSLPKEKPRVKVWLKGNPSPHIFEITVEEIAEIKRLKIPSKRLFD